VASSANIFQRRTPTRNTSVKSNNREIIPRKLYGLQLFMKSLYCYLEHLDSLRLGHAKWLRSWFTL